MGENFPDIAEIGPVTLVMSKNFPMHQYMLDCFLEAVGRGEIKENNVGTVTSKEIYRSRIEDLLSHPKVEEHFPVVNFQEQNRGFPLPKSSMQD